LDSLGGMNPAFTPPYYDGECWCDIIFSASKAQHNLREIFSSASIHEMRFDEYTWTGKTGASVELTSMYTKDNINRNSMKLTSSFNIFVRSLDKNIEYDKEGNIISVSDGGVDKGVWVIEPKFETPMLNFSNNSVRPLTASGGRFTSDINNGTLTIPTKASESVPRGMWHQFGVFPDSPNKGIFLEIEEVPRTWTTNRLSLAPAGIQTIYDNGNLKSLLDVIPFEKTSTRLGEVADNKVIKEAVVAVPFVESASGRRFFNLSKGDVASAKAAQTSMSKGTTINTINSDSSIGKILSAMEEYVFPPSFDFVNFPNVVKPIAMYIFEFTHTLTKDDLSHIWQNLPPDIGASFEEAEATVQHELLSGEILKPNDMQNLKFMIFKVKQRAEINYFNKVINKNANADERYDFGVSIGRRQKEKYSYNWPYDFFSLVEFVKMDSEITFTSKKRRDE
jgi:hypothetical protein